MSERAYMVSKAERGMGDGRRRDATGAMLAGGALGAGAAAFGANAAANRYSDRSAASAKLKDRMHSSARNLYARDRTIAAYKRQVNEASMRSEMYLERASDARAAAKKKIQSDYNDYLHDGSKRYSRDRDRAKSFAQYPRDAGRWYRRKALEEKNPEYYRQYLASESRAHDREKNFKSSQVDQADTMNRRNAKTLRDLKSDTNVHMQGVNRELRFKNEATDSLNNRRAELKPVYDKHVAAGNKAGIDEIKYKRRSGQFKTGSKGALVASGALGAGYLARAGYKGLKRNEKGER